MTSNSALSPQHSALVIRRIPGRAKENHPGPAENQTGNSGIRKVGDMLNSMTANV
jgi:hypothetical protein